MPDERGERSPRQETFGPGRGPQALAQLQATGAEVLGSDGIKIGRLKKVYGSNFSVDRGLLRREIYVPVRHVKEIDAQENIVLDVTAEQAGEMGWEKGGGRPNPPTSSSESDRVEKGTWEIRREQS